MDWLWLTELADEGSLARGQDYAARGLVVLTTASDDSVVAVAHGSSTYDVVLHATSWSCTCPVGMSTQFCKHLVGTAVLASGDVEPAMPVHGLSGPDDAVALITQWLVGLDQASAAKVLRELGEQLPAATELLTRIAARSSGDVAGYAEIVDSLKTRRFLDWRAASDHGRRAHVVVDELAAALTPATAPGLLPLVETGIRHLVRAILRSDDSSGIQGDAATRLIELHADTANLAGPDPVKLARWLVRMGVDDQDLFEFDVVRYADLLGERGLATYRKELDKRLVKTPDSFWANRGVQRLAVVSGDVAEIVRLVGRDFAGPHAYTWVVEALLEAGHPDVALRYALIGITEARLVPHQTIELYDAAARLMPERGDQPEVLRLRREQLTRIPNASSYASLRKAATAMSVWPEERLAALDVLLDRNPREWLARLIDEGEVDLAWDASLGMELDRSMQLTLARARAKTRPGDVFDSYVDLIEATLQTTGKRSYRQAAAYLGELHRAAAAAGFQEEYGALVRDLSDKHRRRPTLVAMLKRLPA